MGKKNGRFELFDEGKIVKGLKKACKGRPVTTEDILAIAQQVEDSIRSEGVVRVSSRQIGLAILEPLKKLDAVAYLRFARVYENFTCAEDFKRAASDLQNSK
ncbi:MAG: transcriptional repressor NrdR [Aeriscardovia sp.]|nr:transcriptional repressor NrdR [Aeriscardovia sp.]